MELLRTQGTRLEFTMNLDKLKRQFVRTEIKYSRNKYKMVQPNENPRSCKGGYSWLLTTTLDTHSRAKGHHAMGGNQQYKFQLWSSCKRPESLSQYVGAFTNPFPRMSNTYSMFLYLFFNGLYDYCNF